MKTLTTGMSLKKTEDYFQHPYLMTYFMFIAEFLCLPAFYMKRWIMGPDPEEKTGRRINPLLCIIPALCDNIGAAILYNAYNFAAASVVQMLTGIRIIMTAVLAKIFIKKPFYRHHFFGLLFIFIGLFLVGIAALRDESGNSTVLGVVMLIVGYIFSPVQFVIEEKLFDSYAIHPLEIVGYEGAAGIIISGLMIFGFQYIPCTRVRQEGDYDIYPQIAFCPYNRLEESGIGFYQIENSGIMIILVLIVIGTLCIFNFTGQGVTKHLTGTARATVSVIQTIVVWAVCLMISWEQFLWLQFVGFIISAFGSLIYNEVWVPGWCELNYYTRVQIAIRDEASHKKLDS